MVTFGWHLRSFGATSFYLGTATMKYNSALCFLALAVGLLCIDIHWFKLQKLVSLLTIAIASATLSQYIFSWNIGVDQLFSFDVWQPHNPGRMAPISAVAFILAGILLFTHKTLPHTQISLYDNLLTVFLTIPLFVLFAYVFATTEIANTPLLKGMPFHVCTNFLAFVFSLMLLTHSKGGAGLLTRNTRHGSNFRVLFFLILVLPLTLGSVLRYAIDENWIGSGIGIAIFCLFSTMLTSIALAHHTIVLDHWVKRVLGEKRITALLQQQIHELLEIAEDGILLFDEELKLLHGNSGAERILGYSRDELKSMYIEQLLPAHRSNNAYIELDQYIHDPNSPASFSVQNRLHLKHKNGKEIPVSVSLTKKKHTDQTLLIAIIKDISELDDRLKLLEKRAFVDPLTQTLNRTAFQSFADKLSLHELRKSDNTFCALLMDIDDFKSINDTFGHDAGDMVLIHFAKAIKTVLRNGDRLFRTGGEEFVIITTNLSEKDAKRFAQRVLQVVRACKIVYDNKRIKITCSIGVCVIDSHKSDIFNAVKRADQAMYQAKRQGKNRVVMDSLLSNVSPVSRESH